MGIPILIQIIPAPYKTHRRLEISWQVQTIYIYGANLENI